MWKKPPGRKSLFIAIMVKVAGALPFCLPLLFDLDGADLLVRAGLCVSLSWRRQAC
jgi:hypothetical protein